MKPTKHEEISRLNHKEKIKRFYDSVKHYKLEKFIIRRKLNKIVKYLDFMMFRDDSNERRV